LYFHKLIKFKPIALITKHPTNTVWGRRSGQNWDSFILIRR
jgi:hypothetical protein